ncbi:conserved hypothetical protein [Burkholderia mallei ATCC 23344]|nr:conserved hypothetical protein [Burkholderia mallei ATCC 23344]
MAASATFIDEIPRSCTNTTAGCTVPPRGRSQGCRPSSTFSEANMSQAQGHPVTPYGVAIHQAIADGDLAQMKSLRTQAQALLAQQGNLATALELLEVEIAKLERRK